MELLFRHSRVRYWKYVYQNIITNIIQFLGHLNSKQLPLEASFSPDSQFVISGSSDGRIHIWNCENGQKVCVLNGDHQGPVHCVQVSLSFQLQFSHEKIFCFSSIPNSWWWLQPAASCHFGYRLWMVKLKYFSKPFLNFVFHSYHLHEVKHS